MSLRFERLRHFLIDLDGVLYLGNTALPGAEPFIGWLRSHDMAFRLVTNNATLTPQQYVEKLSRMGITVSAEEVFTSALATAAFLAAQRPAPTSAYVVGEGGLETALKDAGIRLTDDHPDWVVVGLDRQFTYEKLATALRAIHQGARFVGTNPDTSLPSEHGLLPGAGAIQAALAAASGIQPVVIGKPQVHMIDQAIKELGATRTDTVMLGDRLDTDIQAAAAAVMPSIMVLTGVSTREDLNQSVVQPDLIVADLEELMRVWRFAP